MQLRVKKTISEWDLYLMKGDAETILNELEYQITAGIKEKIPDFIFNEKQADYNRYMDPEYANWIYVLTYTLTKTEEAEYVKSDTISRSRRKYRGGTIS